MFLFKLVRHWRKLFGRLNGVRRLHFFRLRRIAAAPRLHHYAKHCGQVCCRDLCPPRAYPPTAERGSGTSSYDPLPGGVPDLSAGALQAKAEGRGGSDLYLFTAKYPKFCLTPDPLTSTGELYTRPVKMILPDLLFLWKMPDKGKIVC
jgi:hypothetical protein